jgi:hypothetical protein
MVYIPSGYRLILVSTIQQRDYEINIGFFVFILTLIYCSSLDGSLEADYYLIIILQAYDYKNSYSGHNSSNG